MAQFIKIINLILEDINLEVAILFLNNVSIKGLYTNYNREEALPSIQRFILKYIQNLNRTLERIKRARAFINAKSQFYKNGLNIVRFICNLKGREPSIDKVIRIIN